MLSRRHSSWSDVSTTSPHSGGDSSDQSHGHYRSGGEDRRRRSGSGQESRRRHSQSESINVTDSKSTCSENFQGLSQIAVDFNLHDLWPGIVDAKLRHYGICRREELETVVVTDAMGVELDLWSQGARFPENERFPLKLHFRASFCGPQNLGREECQKSGSLLRSYSGDLQARGHSHQRSGHAHGYGHGHKDNHNSHNNLCTLYGQTPGHMFQHTVELAAEGILREIIDWKLEALGEDCTEHQNVLVTDHLGIVVRIEEGVPSAAQFPLKLYFQPTAQGNNNAAAEMQALSSWLPWHRPSSYLPEQDHKVAETAALVPTKKRSSVIFATVSRLSCQWKDKFRKALISHKLKF